MRNGIEDDNREFFAKFVSVLFDEIAVVLKKTTSVACLVHAILLNDLLRRGKLLIRNKHKLMGFLTACCTDTALSRRVIRENEKASLHEAIFSMTVPLESEVWATADAMQRERGMMELYQ